MKTFIYLSSCSTCKRILKEINLNDSFNLQDLKSEPISEEILDKLYKETNSYEALINKRGNLYKEYGLKDLSLEDLDYKKYLLEHYTFIKRPILIDDERIFIGNAKKTVEAIKEHINEE
jgi:arsenate reductase